MIKTAMLAACAAVLAIAALPAFAGAEETNHPGDPFLEELPENTKHFTVEGSGHATLTSEGGNITCESFEGTGEFEDEETGWVEFTFYGCTGPFGIKCTTAGEEAGTITTATLPFHLKTALHEHDETEEGVGVLITPGGASSHDASLGFFATFNCSAFFHIEVIGKGIVGTITAPEEHVNSNTATIVFQANGSGEQTHRTVTHDTTTYDLTSVRNGGATETAAEDAHGTLKFHEGVEPKIETTPDEETP